MTDVMPTPYLLHQLLWTSAETFPDRVAVTDKGRDMRYDELEARSNQLAHLLSELGVTRGERVGLYVEKSIESVVAVYAVLKCGAAYVPLDPQAPTARLAFIARDCGIRSLLTGVEKACQWNELIAAAPKLQSLIVLNGAESPLPQATIPARLLTADALDRRPTSPLMTECIDADLAYVLYTSGSTGDPKGVMLSHRNALAFVRWAAEAFDISSEDRLSSHAPFHFDLSVFDLFAASAAGACVVLVPPKTSVFPVEVSRFIEREGITVWYSVPSILSLVTLHGNLQRDCLPGLRTVLFAGEVFPTKYLRQLMYLLPHARFFNLYGPTETNVCTYYEVPPLPLDQEIPIPIGRAITNDEVFAVTDDGRLAGIGEVGELYVRGATVMRGYWGDKDRTAKMLVGHPFDGMATDLVYRTGDLVQQGEDGNYRLLGRRDAQIKSRGYRIELGEVEATLYAHSYVVECAVIAVPDELITNRIKAYLVVREPISVAELVGFCAKRIPRYMIPELFEFREVLPKTSTGKVDRQSLAANLVLT